MAPKPIVVKITGDAEDLERAAKDAGNALDKLGKKADSAGSATSGFGDKAGGVAKDRLGPLGDAAGMAGVDLDNMGAGALVAGAAIVGVGAFAAQGVTKFIDLADSVREFQTVSGATWEDSSRLVAVSDDLGISAETAAASMGRLAKNIDAGKMAEFGIEVVRTKDGTVDMAATLGNVADAMNRTVDPAKKAAMGSALFGKSWSDMAPLLEQGGAGIREMMAAVSDGQIVTEENARAAREWSMALDDAQDAVSDLQMAIGKEMLPTLTLLAKDFAAVSGAVSKLSDGQLGLSRIQEVFSPIAHIYGERLRMQAEAAKEAAGWAKGLGVEIAAAGLAGADAAVKAQKLADVEASLATQTKVLADRQKDAAATTKALGDQLKVQEDRVKSLRDMVMSIVGVQLAFESAQRDTTAAAATLEEKTKDLHKAQNDFGEDTPQVAAAQLDYEESLAKSKEQADKMAKATVDLAREQAIATGKTFGAEQATLVYRDALVKARDAATDPTLISGLNGLIALVDETAISAGKAADKANAMEQAFRTAAGVAAGVLSVDSSGAVSVAPIGNVEFSGRAHGGPVAAGRPYMVGEQGPEMIVPGQNGTVLTAQQTGQALAGGGGGTTIVINSPIGRPDDVVAWIREQLRRDERGRR